MSDRLKFFRKLMSAFEGTSNPQRAVERGFYINLPNNPVAEITGRIALRPSSMHLLFGGIGSGKTTQLLMTQTALNGLDDIKAIYVDVSLVTDISDLQSGALIVIAGLELIKILDNIKEPELEHSKKIINNAAYGYSDSKYTVVDESISRIVPGLKRVNETVHYKGLLSSEKQQNIEQILQAFSNLNKFVQEKITKGVVFLFDGLDRLGNSQVFIDSALEDVLKLRNTGVGTVLVGSIVTVYKGRESITNFDRSSYYIPYLDVFESDEAKIFFANLLDVRDPENFINPDVRQFLIFKSGGVLRDLMSLCQAAIEEAYIDGSDQIKQKHADQALLPMFRSKTIGFNNSTIDKLYQVRTENLFTPRTSEDFELLLAGHILEYRYPRQRFVVHPILSRFIKEYGYKSAANE